MQADTEQLSFEEAYLAALKLYWERQRDMVAYLPPDMREKTLCSIDVFDKSSYQKAISSDQSLHQVRSFVKRNTGRGRGFTVSSLNFFIETMTPDGQDFSNQVAADLSRAVRDLKNVGALRAGYLTGEVPGRGIDIPGTVSRFSLSNWAKHITTFVEEPETLLEKRDPNAGISLYDTLAGQVQWDAASVRAIRHWAKPWYPGPYDPDAFPKDLRLIQIT